MRASRGRLAIHRVLAELEVDWIDGSQLAALDPEGRSFFNMNTPDDLAPADAMAVEARARP